MKAEGNQHGKAARWLNADDSLVWMRDDVSSQANVNFKIVPERVDAPGFAKRRSSWLHLLRTHRSRTTLSTLGICSSMHRFSIDRELQNEQTAKNLKDKRRNELEKRKIGGEGVIEITLVCRVFICRMRVMERGVKLSTR